MEAYVLYLWLGAGALMLALEMSGLSGVGFLFAGLASFVVAILISTDLLLPTDYLLQWGWFFAATVVWAALLWKPMQKFLLSHKGAGYQDMIGQTAIVGAGGLSKGHDGQATWSGTVMMARLENSAAEHVPAGAAVEIVGVKGSTLLVKPRG